MHGTFWQHHLWLQMKSQLPCVKQGRSILSMRTHHSVLYTTSGSNPQESLRAYSKGEHDASDVLPLLWPLTTAAFTLAGYSCPWAQILQSCGCNPPVWESLQREEPSMYFCCAPIRQFYRTVLDQRFPQKINFSLFSKIRAGESCRLNSPFHPSTDSSDWEITAAKSGKNYEEQRKAKKKWMRIAEWVPRRDKKEAALLGSLATAESIFSLSVAACL